MPRLTDAWFDAEFYGEATAKTYRLQGVNIEGAQGLFLWCPCGFGKPAFPLEGARPHGVMIPFANPRNAPQLPEDHGPTNKGGTKHPRWTMSGTGLGDLTLTPSVDVGNDSCWHGSITNGELT